MAIRQLRSAAIAFLGTILWLAAGDVKADITVQTTTSVDGVGPMAFANMSGTSITVISGDKSRIDSDMKMQSKIIGFLARNSVGPTADIVLLDQGKLLHLNIAKKEYTETTFEELRAEMRKMSDQVNSSGEQRQQPSVVDQSKCEWLPAKVDVNKSGEKAQFAGYDAQRVTLTATQPCKDKETGSICEIALVLDQWMSADFSESSETRRFYTDYASKMGVDPMNSQDVSQRAKALFSQYKGVWTEVAAKMQTVKGYPVKSSFTLGMGGAQCKDSSTQQSQQGQSAQSNGDLTTPGGVAGALAGKLGGFFKRKDSPDAPPAQPPPAIAPVPMPLGDVALITVSSQLISVSTAGVNADEFSVPPGFKKLEMNKPDRR